MNRTICLFVVALVALLAAPASAQLSAPSSSGVSSYVSHTSRGRLVNYACTPISRRGHKGTDFPVPIGTSVAAAAAGTVVHAEDGHANNGSLRNHDGGGFGNHVIISHADGRTTLYAHLSPGSVRVRRGQHVECGQQIGLSGHSGHSTGPHLHFEVRSGMASSRSAYFGLSVVDPYGGACSSQTQSLWNGGRPTRTCESTASNDDSAFVRATHPDQTFVQPGQELTQEWTLRNSGTTTWTTSGGYRLEHAGGASLEGLRRMDVPSDVRPNANGSFSVTVRAPMRAGTYTARYRMASNANPGFGTVVTIKLRVADAPRSCRSRTLGRDVPSGECVQVDYAACGASSCAWFRCADGAWQCTAEASCGGETHESAACGTAADPECSMAAQPCTSVSECCGGLLCAPAAAGGRECCAGPEMPCENDGDCCGQMRCGAGGTCECVPDGQPASSTLDCCGSSYRTSAGVCGHDS
ncbi:MAG: peptidoglycan DD-metalloendopeptidase family protein [Sandaracinus sp.]